MNSVVLKAAFVSVEKRATRPVLGVLLMVTPLILWTARIRIVDNGSSESQNPIIGPGSLHFRSISRIIPRPHPLSRAKRDPTGRAVPRTGFH